MPLQRPECEQCSRLLKGLGDWAYSVVIVTPMGRRIGQMWVCKECCDRMVNKAEPPAVGARWPRNGHGAAAMWTDPAPPVTPTVVE